MNVNIIFQYCINQRKYGIMSTAFQQYYSYNFLYIQASSLYLYWACINDYVIYLLISSKLINP